MLEDNSNLALDEAIEVVKQLIEAIRERSRLTFLTEKERKALDAAEKFLAYRDY